MMIEQKKFAEVVKAIVRSQLADVHTSLPARVVEYDKVTRMASVQPLLKARVKRETTTTIEPMPLITRVPVMFQSTTRNGVTFPIREGDLVWVMFAEHAIDRLLVSTGELQDPKSPVRFSINGAVCIPGFNTTQTPSDQVDDDAMVIHGDEIRLGSKTATQKVALVPGVQAALVGALSSASIADALYTYGSTPPGPAKTAALAALVVAVNSHFATNPVQGATKVEAE